jgi:D-alanyl-D-alanine carboxypeptidase
MASLTKIMTCYLTCILIKKKNINPGSTIVKVSKIAANTIGTSANLKHVYSE